MFLYILCANRDFIPIRTVDNVVDNVDKSNMVTPSYEIDRKAASKLLKVSLRTVDRYVRQGRLTSENRDGRIWFTKAVIDEFSSRQSRQSRHGGVDNVDKSGSKRVDIVDSIPVEDMDTVVRPKKKKSAEPVFKNLYEDAKKKLEGQQERLEAANYRVGQLEAQLKNTVPLLTYEEERSKAHEVQRELKDEIKDRDKKLTVAEKVIREERLNRIIIAAVLFIVLALQPVLWFLLR